MSRKAHTPRCLSRQHPELAKRSPVPSTPVAPRPALADHPSGKGL